MKKARHMTVKQVAVIVGGIAAFAGGWLLDEQRVRRIEQRFAAMQKQVDSIAAAPSPSETSTVAIVESWREPARPATEAPAPSAVGVAQARHEEPIAAQPPLDIHETRNTLQTAFEADQPRPMSWGGMSLREGQARLQAVLPEGSLVRSFECHETICRIESMHPDDEHYRQFARAAFMDTTTQIWNAPVFLTQLNEGAGKDEPLAMVAYIAQPGQQLFAQ
jgi:hypothetical protein